MRILYVLNSGQPGGMEQHVLDLVTGMKAKGHDVYVWCNSGPITEWYRTAGAEVYIKSLKCEIDPFYIRNLKEFIIEKNIQVVHSHELKASINALLAGRGLSGLVKVTHTHTPISEWRISQFKKRLNLFFFKKFINRYSSVEIALTETRRKTKVAEGITPEKLYIIPNGINMEKFDIGAERKSLYRNEIVERFPKLKDKFVFGNIGRLSIEKGIADLLDAYASLIGRNTEFRSNTSLLLAGGGPLEQEFKEKIKELKIENNVVITGKFENPDLVKFYSVIDLFIHPSHAEGFGIVLIEALASRIPVICTDLPVFKEVAATTVYKYYSVGDYLTLASEMEAALIERGYNVDKGIERISNLYNMDRFWQMYEDLYTSLEVKLRI